MGQNVKRMVSNDGWVLQRGSFIQGHVGQNVRRVVLKDECFFYGGVPLDRDMSDKLSDSLNRRQVGQTVIHRHRYT